MYCANPGSSLSSRLDVPHITFKSSIHTCGLKFTENNYDSNLPQSNKISLARNGTEKLFRFFVHKYHFSMDKHLSNIFLYIIFYVDISTGFIRNPRVTKRQNVCVVSSCFSPVSMDDDYNACYLTTPMCF